LCFKKKENKKTGRKLKKKDYEQRCKLCEPNYFIRKPKLVELVDDSSLKSWFEI
jgi:hypothetical protein